MPDLEQGAGLAFQIGGNIGIYVYQTTVGGIVYYVAVMARSTGTFTLIDSWTTPGRVINNALAAANTYLLSEVKVCGANYPLEMSVTFPASNLELLGMGRTTFFDGDDLATNVHAIVISGMTDCIVRDLAVQTQDGGGKTCHCIFIEDGADRFRVESVIFIASDSNEVHIEGTSITGGWIVFCEFAYSDNEALYSDMDAGSVVENIAISVNDFHHNSTDCIQMDNARWIIISNNNMYYVTASGYGMDLNVFFFSSVEGNTITGCITAIRIQASCTNNVFSENIIDGTSQDGIICNGNWNIIQSNSIYDAADNGISIELAISWNNSITDNLISTTGQHGIQIVNNNSFLEISNNCFDMIGYKAGTWYGIYLTGTSESNIIGNTLFSVDSSAIFLDGNSNNNQIEANLATDCGGYGINISVNTCNHNRVLNNKLQGNGAGCINDAGTDTELPEVTVYVVDPGGVIGTHPAVVLTDGVDVLHRFEFQIPSDFQELVRARIILVPGGTGNLRRSVSSNWGKICTENYNTDTDSIVAGEVAVTINALTCIDVAAALTGIAAKDLVGLEFTRHGSHANDTINAHCYLLALNIQYV